MMCWAPRCSNPARSGDSVCDSCAAEAEERTAYLGAELLGIRAALQQEDPDLAPEQVVSRIEQEIDRRDQAIRAREAAARMREMRERGESLESYAARAIDGICEQFAGDVAGGRGRNNSLAAAAYRVGRILGGTGIDGSHDLHIVAIETGLPHREVSGVIARQVKKGAANPVEIRERPQPDHQREEPHRQDRGAPRRRWSRRPNSRRAPAR